MKPAEYHLTENPRLQRWCGGIGLAALLLCAVGYAANPVQFHHSWLAAFFFVISIALGALIFTMILHLTGATWSVPVRRLFENLAAPMPLFFILFLPVLSGVHELYHWSHGEAVAKDPLLQLKAPYLNQVFFAVRTVIYFAVWTFLACRLRHLSLQQDEGDDHSERLRRTSAAGVILFALTLTFAAFDWFMSLDAHWYSTIFGLYIFSGCVVAGLAAVILLARHLQSRGHLVETIGIQQYHDLGKLLFAFTVFWAYMAVSQYFLIWYGNIPEETIWYHHRWHGSWKVVSLLLVFGHFLVPFVLLLTRWAKRNLAVLAGFSIWLLFMHWVDLQWLVMPSLHKEGFVFSWIDGAALAGCAGLYLKYLGWLLRRSALAPVGDPRLAEAVEMNR